MNLNVRRVHIVNTIHRSFPNCDYELIKQFVKTLVEQLGNTDSDYETVSISKNFLGSGKFYIKWVDEGIGDSGIMAYKYLFKINMVRPWTEET